MFNIIEYDTTSMVFTLCTVMLFVYIFADLIEDERELPNQDNQDNNNDIESDLEVECGSTLNVLDDLLQSESQSESQSDSDETGSNDMIDITNILEDKVLKQNLLREYENNTEFEFNDVHRKKYDWVLDYESDSE